jgi:hypothetical protein
MDWELDTDDLPPDFSYPREYIRLVELGMTNPEPWYQLVGADLLSSREALRRDYPSHDYVPFASDQQNDDYPCWERLDDRWSVIVVHVGTLEGHERGAAFPDTYAWFRQAVEDMIEFDEDWVRP